MKIRCKGIANKSARDEVLDVYFYEIEFDIWADFGQFFYVFMGKTNKKKIEFLSIVASPLKTFCLKL